MCHALLDPISAQSSGMSWHVHPIRQPVVDADLSLYRVHVKETISAGLPQLRAVLPAAMDYRSQSKANSLSYTDRDSAVEGRCLVLQGLCPIIPSLCPSCRACVSRLAESLFSLADFAAILSVSISAPYHKCNNCNAADCGSWSRVVCQSYITCVMTDRLYAPCPMFRPARPFPRPTRPVPSWPACFSCHRHELSPSSSNGCSPWC